MNEEATAVAVSSLQTIYREATDAEQTPFEQLIQSGLYDYHYVRGQIINGRVAGTDKDGLLVDIGTKCEALLPHKEIADYALDDPFSLLPLGGEFEFYILRDEAANTRDLRMILSYRRVAQARIWSSLEECKVNDSICEARILEVVKGGVVVDIDGLRGFIPASHLRVKGGSNNPDLVGETIPCTILEIDRQNNKLILSQKLAISQLYAEQREQLMNELYNALSQYESEVVQGLDPQPITIAGEVVRITDFGAFVKIQDTEMDGLLPLSEISWQRIAHPSEKLKVGAEVVLQVLNVTPEQSRISLSLKRLTPDPWLDVRTQVKVGDIVTGTVLRTNNYGAVLSCQVAGKPLEDYGFESFLPADELAGAGTRPNEDLLAGFSTGQNLKVAIKRIKEEDRRLILCQRCFDEHGELVLSILQEDRRQHHQHSQNNR